MMRKLLVLVAVPLFAVALAACLPHVHYHYEMIGDSNLENSERQVTNWFHIQDNADMLDVDGLAALGACASRAPGDPSLPGTYWSQRVPELRAGWASDQPVALVVMLGTNDLVDRPCATDYATAMDSIVNAATWTHIFWLNQRTDASICTDTVVGENVCVELNEQEAAYALRHPRVRILDYNAHFSGHPEWFSTDPGGPVGGNVHLNPAGSDEFSHWLRDELNANV